MNDDFKSPLAASPEPDAPTMGMSSVYRLFEAFIALREKNERQHKLFEQTLNRTRDNLEGRFNSFAADDGRYRTPRMASGISAMMISALKMTADRMAEVGEDSRMMFSAPRPG